tara:strand:+ start:880 stop:1218 length:339 start_codon:yes stop_codon:yes gene_type:complete
MSELLGLLVFIYLVDKNGGPVSDAAQHKVTFPTLSGMAVAGDRPEDVVGPKGFRKTPVLISELVVKCCNGANVWWTSEPATSYRDEWITVGEDIPGAAPTVFNLSLLEKLAS